MEKIFISDIIYFRRQGGVKMTYKSIDEMETLALRDATIVKFEISDSGNWLELELTGVVVKDGNSQNEFYTDKYADNMTIRFKSPEFEAVLLEGHKYYDANDKLIESVPDKPVEKEKYKELFQSFKEQIVFYGGRPDVNANCYQMIIDVDEESYVISFFYEKAIAEWHHFLNKANIG
jgi:hypothetical protein